MFLGRNPKPNMIFTIRICDSRRIVHLQDYPMAPALLKAGSYNWCTAEQTHFLESVRRQRYDSRVANSIIQVSPYDRSHVTCSLWSAGDDGVSDHTGLEPER